MKSFTCLFMLLLVVMPCAALNATGNSSPIGLEVLELRDNPLGQNVYNVPRIIADNPGTIRCVHLYTLTTSSSNGGSISAPGDVSFQ